MKVVNVMTKDAWSILQKTSVYFVNNHTLKNQLEYVQNHLKKWTIVWHTSQMEYAKLAYMDTQQLTVVVNVLKYGKRIVQELIPRLDNVGIATKEFWLTQEVNATQTIDAQWQVVVIVL